MISPNPSFARIARNPTLRAAFFAAVPRFPGPRAKYPSAFQNPPVPFQGLERGFGFSCGPLLALGPLRYSHSFWVWGSWFGFAFVSSIIQILGFGYKGTVYGLGMGPWFLTFRCQKRREVLVQVVWMA